MFEMMNQQALAVGANRRREQAIQTMRDARHPGADAVRRVVGLGLVAVGQRLGGDAASGLSAQQTGDCA